MVRQLYAHTHAREYTLNGPRETSRNGNALLSKKVLLLLRCPLFRFAAAGETTGLCGRGERRLAEPRRGSAGFSEESNDAGDQLSGIPMQSHSVSDRLERASNQDAVVCPSQTMSSRVPRAHKQ